MASGVPVAGDLPGLGVARRVISAGTYFLTLPGLTLLLGSGIALVWGRARLLENRWLRIMLLAAGAIVVNTALVVLPAVRSATALAQEGAAAGRLAPSYARAYAIESSAGAVNVALTLVAMASGIWGSRVKKAEGPKQLA